MGRVYCITVSLNEGARRMCAGKGVGMMAVRQWDCFEVGGKSREPRSAGGV